MLIGFSNDEYQMWAETPILAIRFGGATKNLKTPTLCLQILRYAQDDTGMRLRMTREWGSG